RLLGHDVGGGLDPLRLCQVLLGAGGGGEAEAGQAEGRRHQGAEGETRHGRYSAGQEGGKAVGGGGRGRGGTPPAAGVYTGSGSGTRGPWPEGRSVVRWRSHRLRYPPGPAGARQSAPDAPVCPNRLAVRGRGGRAPRDGLLRRPGRRKCAKAPHPSTGRSPT